MRLKELRETKKLNQTNLAKELDIPRVNYNKYENHEVEPNIQTLCKIADYYNVSLDYLCERNNGNYDLPALSTEQIQLVQVIVKLNEANLMKAFAYTTGLLAGQN